MFSIRIKNATIWIVAIIFNLFNLTTILIAIPRKEIYLEAVCIFVIALSITLFLAYIFLHLSIQKIKKDDQTIKRCLKELGFIIVDHLKYYPQNKTGIILDIKLMKNLSGWNKITFILPVEPKHLSAHQYLMYLENIKNLKQKMTEIIDKENLAKKAKAFYQQEIFHTDKENAQEIEVGIKRENRDIRLIFRRWDLQT